MVSLALLLVSISNLITLIAVLALKNELQALKRRVG